MKLGKIAIFICVLAPLTTLAQIPGAQQQPQWAMPFYFEDGNDYRDTIWVGYDTSAGQGVCEYDSTFYEFQHFDMSAFNAILCEGFYSPSGTLPSDSGYKVAIQSSEKFLADVSFINGNMPLTVTWNDSFFHSKSLPFPDLSPAPAAKAIVSCNDMNPNYFNCPLEYEALTLTDSVVPDMMHPHQDSLVFEGNPNWSVEESIDMKIMIYPWDDYTYVGIKKQEKSLKLTIYPNPVEKKLFIENKNKDAIKAILQRIEGSKIYQDEIPSFQTVSIPMAHLPPGIYLLSIVEDHRYETHKIIKL